MKERVERDRQRKRQRETDRKRGESEDSWQETGKEEPTVSSTAGSPSSTMLPTQLNLNPPTQQFANL